MAADGHSPFNQSSSVKSRILRGALYNECAQALAAVLTRIEELTLHEIAALGRADQLEEVL